MEELKKVFEVMHVVNVERVELSTYQLRIWLGLRSIGGKGTKLIIHDIQVGLALKKHSWGIYFYTRELKEAKV